MVKSISHNTDQMTKDIFRVYSADVNYQKLDLTFAKMDPSSAVAVGDILLRDKLTVKTAFKGDSVIFSPDKGEWSVTIKVSHIVLVGAASVGFSAVPIVKPGEPDTTIMDGGKFEINTTSKGSRFLIPAGNSVTDFLIGFTITPTNCKLIYKDGSVWFEAGGNLVLSLGAPAILDTKLNIIGGGLEPLDLITFSLVDNKDGTWTYTKSPGEDFASAKLPKDYWIDADVQYTQSYGCLWYNGVFATSRAAAVATSTNATGYMGLATGNIFRSPVFFDLSSLSGTVIDVTHYIHGYNIAQTPRYIYAQLGTFSLPIVKADYSLMSPDLDSGEFGHTAAAWDETGWNNFDYNATGISAVQDNLGVTMPVMLRGENDYLNDANPEYLNAFSAAAGEEMYLSITITAPAPTGIYNPWHGFSKTKRFLTW